MPQLPENITLVTKDGEPYELRIDGAEFPWWISESGVTISYLPRGLAEITLGILVGADRLDFVEPDAKADNHE